MMRWIRANLKAASWLALFALAIQLMLSFGHVHHNGGPGSAALAFKASAGTAVALNDNDNAPAMPAAPTGDYCAICAVISMISAAAPPIAPAITVPDISNDALLGPVAEGHLASLPYFFAQARAPPEA